MTRVSSSSTLLLIPSLLWCPETVAQAEWVETAKLIDESGQSRDFYGRSRSMSNEILAIGASGANYADESAGAVFVYNLQAGSWTQQARLTASDADVLDGFGAVSTYGDIIAVGAPGDDEAAYTAGAVYIFARAGRNLWSETQKLMPDDAVALGSFGSTVALYQTTLAITSPWDDDLGRFSGSVYIYGSLFGTWTQQQKLTASDGAAEDYFGSWIAMSEDRLIVGAPYNDEKGFRAGAAYVFERRGSVWTEAAKLVASDGAANDNLGGSVTLEGNIVCVGSKWHTNEDVRSGAVYVYEEVAGTWTEQAQLFPRTRVEGMEFGSSLALRGRRLVVGSYGDNESTGSAFFFEKLGLHWTEQAMLKASDGEPSDRFGRVEMNGGYIYVGAPGENDDQGSAYLYNVKGVACNRWLEPCTSPTECCSGHCRSQRCRLFPRFL